MDQPVYLPICKHYHNNDPIQDLPACLLDTTFLMITQPNKKLKISVFIAGVRNIPTAGNPQSITCIALITKSTSVSLPPERYDTLTDLTPYRGHDIPSMQIMNNQIDNLPLGPTIICVGISQAYQPIRDNWEDIYLYIE